MPCRSTPSLALLRPGGARLALRTHLGVVGREELEDHVERLDTDLVEELDEHVERLGLVLDDRVLLSVGAQVDPLLEVVHLAQVILPLVVHDREACHLLEHRHRLGADHIEIGSFVAIAAMTGGEVRIKDAVADDRVGAEVGEVGGLLGGGRARERRPDRGGAAGPALVEQQHPIVAESARHPARRRDRGTGRLVAGTALEEDEVGPLLATDGGDQYLVSPSLRLDWRGRRTTVEFEAGGEWANRDAPLTGQSKDRRWWVSLGYRLDF